MEAISPWLTREHVVGLLSILWPAYVAVVGVWIVLQRRAPVATLSWLLSMAVIPVLGLVIYYFLGPRRLKRQRLRRLRSRRRSRVRGSMARQTATARYWETSTACSPAATAGFAPTMPATLA